MGVGIVGVVFRGEQEGSAGEVIGGAIGLALDDEGVGGCSQAGHFKVSDLHGVSTCYFGTSFVALDRETETQDGASNEVMKVADLVWRPAFEISLREPLSCGGSRRILIDPLLDIFHPLVSPSWIAKVFDVMAAARHHTFVVPTRHSDRMLTWTHSNRAKPLPNVWLGAVVENQEKAAERIPDLLRTPAVLRFIWCEPLLGLIDLESWIDGLDWVVASGGVGMDAVPVHPGWVRWLRDQCVKAQKPFFFRQWGEWLPEDQVDVRGRFPSVGHHVLLDRGGNSGKLRGIDRIRIYRVGKNTAGNLLDSRSWTKAPTAAVSQAALRTGMEVDHPTTEAGFD